MTRNSYKRLPSASWRGIHAAPRQGPPAPRSQGVISASVVVAPGQIFLRQIHPKTLYLAPFLCL